jgi:hypothetical protein
MPEQSRHSQKTVVTAVWQLLQMLQMVGRHALGALSNELVELAGLVFPLFSIRQSRLASGDDLPSRQPCQLNIEVNHMLLVGWNILFGINRTNWTLWNADRSGSMAKKLGPSRKASTGQTSTQSVYLQRIQASVTTWVIVGNSQIKNRKAQGTACAAVSVECGLF